MTFLKKIGSILAKVGAVAAGLQPIVNTISGFVPNGSTIKNTFQGFVDAIVTMESIGQTLNTPGPDKLRAVIPMVAQEILKADFMIGHKIKDQALFNKAAQGYAQATADLLNSLDESGAKELEH